MEKVIHNGKGEIHNGKGVNNRKEVNNGIIVRAQHKWKKGLYYGIG